MNASDSDPEADRSTDHGTPDGDWADDEGPTLVPDGPGNGVADHLVAEVAGGQTVVDVRQGDPIKLDVATRRGDQEIGLIVDLTDAEARYLAHALLDHANRGEDT